MKVHHENASSFNIKNPVLTLGTFDGVHKGHQAIIQRLNEQAREIGGESVVLTFNPHPRIVLNPDDHGLELIQPIEKRINELSNMGVDHLILFPFTMEFSRTTALDFVRRVLVNQINVHTLNIGYDHHFGRNREGNIELMKNLSEVYDFKVEETSALEVDGIKISSTKIRKAIKEGRIKEANSFLSRTFSIEGRVETGKGLGKNLGYPTANLKIFAPYQLTPTDGVYAVMVKVNGGMHQGIMNIGTTPTVSDGENRTYEVHILDYEENLYGKVVEVFFVEKIRNEMKFDSVEALIDQIKKDEVKARNILVSEFIG